MKNFFGECNMLVHVAAIFYLEIYIELTQI